MSRQIAKTELTISKVIPATSAEVFDAWIDSRSPGSPWFGAAKVILDPKVDGLFYHSVHFEGHDWAHYGRFLKLQRPSQIVHTWVSEATKGLESVVTISLTPKGDQTEFTLRHTNIPDDEMGRRHGEGWGFVLDAIAQKFARKN